MTDLTEKVKLIIKQYQTTIICHCGEVTRQQSIDDFLIEDIAWAIQALYEEATK